MLLNVTTHSYHRTPAEKASTYITMMEAFIILHNHVSFTGTPETVANLLKAMQYTSTHVLRYNRGVRVCSEMICALKHYNKFIRCWYSIRHGSRDDVSQENFVDEIKTLFTSKHFKDDPQLLHRIGDAFHQVEVAKKLSDEVAAKRVVIQWWRDLAYAAGLEF